MSEKTATRAIGRRTKPQSRTKRSKGGHQLSESQHNSEAETAESAPTSTIHVAQSGEWIQAEDLRQQAMEQLGCAASATSPGPGKPIAGKQVDLVLNLGGVDHLDASALQILLAIQAEELLKGRRMQVTNSSALLKQWFEYAGAGALLSPRVKPNVA